MKQPFTRFPEFTLSSWSLKIRLFLLLTLLGTIPAYSQNSDNDRGAFDAYIRVKVKSANDVLYRLVNPNPPLDPNIVLPTPTGNPVSNFQGDLGSFYENESLTISGGSVRSYKKGGCDVYGAGIYYYVHPNGTTNQVPFSTYTEISRQYFRELNYYPFSRDGAQDQEWGDPLTSIRSDQQTNVIAGLAPGSYIIDVFAGVNIQYCTSSSNGFVYYSNNSLNYQVTFTVLQGNAVPLPVTLASLAATRQEANVKLSWQTASEQNNKGYEVQVSTDSRTFRTLSFVPSQGESGTSTTRHSYSYLDTENGKTGTRYYRLRQLDLDGTETFYGPKVVSFSKAGSLVALQVAPNPFANELTLSLPSLEAARTGTVVLTDMLGRTALSQPLTVAAGMSEVRLPELSNLPKGLYHLRLNLNGEVQSVKLLKE